jgi:hypothetical protein
MTKLDIVHSHPMDVDTFWKVFLDADFKRRLYTEALRYPGYELLAESRPPDGRITRRFRAVPDVRMPAAVEKLLGKGASYVDDGHFDPAARRWHYRLIADKLTDRIHVDGQIWAEARGEGRIERLARGTIEVKVFGVGGIMESFFEKNARNAFNTAARFTETFAREKGYI